jgi:hypothetical protein
MDNEFSYEQQLWDSVLMEMIRYGFDVTEASVAASAAITARRAFFNPETN